MFKPKLFLAAGALLGLAGCVTDDSYYGGSSYSYGYPSSGYAYPAYGGGYPSHYRYSDSRLGDCDLKGYRDIVTTPEHCRQIRRDIERRDDYQERRRDERADRDRERERDRQRAERQRDRERAERERDRQRAERDRDRNRDEWRRRAGGRERLGASSARCPAPLTVGPGGVCVGQTE